MAIFPRVVINMAMSVDGKATSVAHEPTNFTSREDKKRLFEIRALCDALVVGARTAAADYESMGIPRADLRAARIKRGQSPHPIRVIISGRLNLSPQLSLFQVPISPLLIVCSKSASTRLKRFFSLRGHLIVCGKKEVDIRQLASILASEYKVRTLLCEGGPTLNDAFFRAHLVDELYLTLCPAIVGGSSAPTLVEGVGVQRLKEASRAHLLSCREGRTEWFLHFRFRK